MDVLHLMNAFTMFLAIAAVGFLFLMVSLFFGEIFEHFDGGLDHDLEHGGPGFFSTRVISVFITAFGGFGAIATHYGYGPLAASGSARSAAWCWRRRWRSSRDSSTASRQVPRAARRISSA